MEILLGHQDGEMVLLLEFLNLGMVQIWCNSGAQVLPTVSPSPQGDTSMATIVQRTNQHGQTSYRAQVRRKGVPPLSATFPKLADARKWVQITEAAILEGRHLPTTEAKRHTLADLIDRYLAEVLPRKGASSIRKQTQQLLWWRMQLGYSIVADITPALLVAYRDKLAWGESFPRSNATVSLYLAALSHVFTIAVKEW
jgi:hypothetical protein